MYHEWGSDFDFKRLYEAEMFIVNFVRTRTGCFISTKEKYGQINYGGLYLPKWNKGPQWLKNLHWGLGRKALKKAILIAAFKKFPELQDEILCDAASDEYLMGTELHNRYWTKYGL